jgi:hypothetical protein
MCSYSPLLTIGSCLTGILSSFGFQGRACCPTTETWIRDFIPSSKGDLCTSRRTRKSPPWLTRSGRGGLFNHRLSRDLNQPPCAKLSLEGGIEVQCNARPSGTCLTDYCRHHVCEATLVEKQRSDMKITRAASGNRANSETSQTGCRYIEYFVQKLDVL